MWKFKAALIVVFSVLFFGGLMPVYATSAESPGKQIRSVSGEIALIDIKLGKLELERNTARHKGFPTVYRINQNDTRVTDPTDTKFLKLEDLQVSQHVTVEFDYIHWEEKQEPIAIKIIASPMSAADAQKASPQGSTTTVTTTTTSTTTK